MPDPAPGDRRAEVVGLVRELLARLEREDVTELTLTRGDLRVRVRRDERPAVRVTAARGAEGALPERPGSEPAAEKGVLEVKAPLTGVFYRAPSPQAQPYVQVGSTVSVGEVIGLIEAMKLFNEIRSTAAGRVRRIFVEGGQLVRAHAPLLEVEPL